MEDNFGKVVTYTPNMLDDYTTGIEVELIGLDSQRYSRICDIMARSTGVSFQETSWNTHLDGDSFWQIKSDGSLSVDNKKRNDYSTTVEVVSPVLTGAKGFNQVHNVFGALREYGFDTNSSCGIHVHVGWRQYFNEQVDNLETAVPEFARVLYYFVKFEKVLDLLLTLQRRENRNRYCRSNYDYFDSNGISLKSSIRDSRTIRNLTNLCGGESRYMKLNYQTLYRNTIEFRAFPGLIDFELVAAWAWLCQKIAHKSMSLDGFDNITPTFEGLIEFICGGSDYKILKGTKKFVRTLYNHAAMLNSVYSEFSNLSNGEKEKANNMLHVTPGGVLHTIMTEGN